MRPRSADRSTSSSAAASRRLPLLLLGTGARDEVLHAGPFVGPDRCRELLQREQLDVGVAARSERVGELLDVAQDRAQLRRAGKQGA